MENYIQPVDDNLSLPLKNENEYGILSTIRGVVVTLIYVANMLFWAVPLFTTAFLKLVIPVKPWRHFCTRVLKWVANCWIFVNNLSTKTVFDTEGIERLSMNSWYMVISNHQTWVDILILQKAFYRKIPFLKFFLKKELIWVPIMGLAWWALDFPFMKRYSENFLQKNPHLRGKDIEITRKACEKYKNMPVSIMNFVEGTRFTPEKHSRQKSPFKHLLRPKAGGVAFVLSSMGDQLTSIVNVTINYPEGAKSFWDFLCGRVSYVSLRVQEIPVTKEILGNYFMDERFREKFQLWLNSLWVEKDRQLDGLRPLKYVVPEI